MSTSVQNTTLQPRAESWPDSLLKLDMLSAQAPGLLGRQLRYNADA